MKMTWTEEQRQVIELRNRNLLVSAAAGSGKTAVLVQRIIGRLLEKEHPVDIDRLLIVTFTNAAAAEMRERILDGVEEALQNEPKNSHLQRQAALVHHAQITTIHSFCLYVIRSYFHTIDLEPNFRIAEEGELNLLQEDVLEEVLNKNYAEAKPEFFELVEKFATGKNDEVLKELLQKLYHFSMSYPWPKEWLKELEKNYNVTGEDLAGDARWKKALEAYLHLIFEDALHMLKECRDLAGEKDGPEHFSQVILEEIYQLEALASCTQYGQMAKLFEALRFGRLPGKRSFNGDKEKLEAFKAKRNQVKEQMKKLEGQFFFETEEEQLCHIQAMQGTAAELSRLCGEYSDAYAAKKRDRNILDFHDLEHFALKILVFEDTKEPTEAARQLRGQFEEIMIDEYQDSNYVQETILKAISREWDKVYNMFMVGDVKQSIYRFRLARPELFMEKYDRYTREDGDCQKIELHKNFRSRSQVLYFTNDIFMRIMQRDLGNVAYDEAAALYPGAEYPVNESCNAQILIADESDEMLAEAGIEDKVQLEARLVAAKIKELMRSLAVTDAKTKKLCPLSFGDIVILVRSMQAFADTFLEVFEKEGIPAHAASRTGYFKTLEIKTILSMLRVLDNPRADIPLAALLRSPIGGFSDSELAQMKAAGGELSFHESVFRARKEGAGIEPGLSVKLAGFWNLLDSLRERVPDLAIHELIMEILDKTGYGNYIAAMPGGKRRQGNVQMLIERAIAYEKTSYCGLFEFIRYMDRLEKYEVDYGEADAFGGEENAVQIMTIHKSKGLEFPVVFLCGTSKKFNKMDTRNRIILHPELGLGLDYIDSGRRLKFPTLLKSVIARQTDLENQGEELRILYVALTRAKEKLIITGTLKDAQDSLDKLKREWENKKGILSFTRRAFASCYLDWILPAAYMCGEKYEPRIYNVPVLVTKEIEDQTGKAGCKELFLEARRRIGRELEAQIEQRLSFAYPFEEEENLKVKYSVSELKHRAMEQVREEPEEGVPLFKEETVIPYVPKFLEGQEEENQGALRGSAMHRAVERLPLSVITGAQKKEDVLKEEIKKLVETSGIQKEEAGLLSIPKLKKFYETGLAKRMARAKENGQLYVEKPFVMGRPACEIQETKSKEMVLIQGIIDAFFIENGEIVLLDYKTDVLKREEDFIVRYEKQLEFYEDALQRALGLKVKEKLIYSFYLGKIIPILEGGIYED